jgi:hypothetical protein
LIQFLCVFFLEIELNTKNEALKVDIENVRAEVESRKNKITGTPYFSGDVFIDDIFCRSCGRNRRLKSSSGSREKS